MFTLMPAGPNTLADLSEFTITVIDHAKLAELPKMSIREYRESLGLDGTKAYKMGIGDNKLYPLFKKPTDIELYDEVYGREIDWSYAPATDTA